jgi:bacterioferritin (cytochrome b1)
MIVNLNPQQFLAVYNSLTLHSSLTAQEVKSKMDLVLIEALSNADDSKSQLKFSNWTKQEEKKVEALKTELAAINLSPAQSQSDDGIFIRPETK